MFRRVICIYEGQYYKINCKYKRYKHIKTKVAAKIFHVHSFAVLFS